MNTTATIFDLRKNGVSWTLDILALLAIYFIPTLSHMLGIPFYLFEPMRIFIILSMLHSGKVNSIALAISLPLFSFFISSHPVLLKAILIAFELTLNVVLFYYLKKRITNYWAVVVSVLSSKIVYYILKFVLIQTALLDSGLISTPIYIQLFTITVFGLYAFLWHKKLK